MRNLLILTGVCLVAGSALAGPPEDIKAAGEAMRKRQFHEAARLLKAVNPETLAASERDRWLINARAAAVRTGDRAWLIRLNKGIDKTEDVADDQIIVASDYLKTAMYDKARQMLETVPNVEKLPLRLQIRYQSVYARLERLMGNSEAERKHLETLLNLANAIPTASDGANLVSASSSAPAFSWANWWPVQRYATLLREKHGVVLAANLLQGRYSVPVRERSASERLRWASLQMAANRTDEAQTTLATVPTPLLTRRGEGVTLTDMTAFP